MQFCSSIIAGASPATTVMTFSPSIPKAEAHLFGHGIALAPLDTASLENIGMERSLLAFAVKHTSLHLSLPSKPQFDFQFSSVLFC